MPHGPPLLLLLALTALTAMAMPRAYVRGVEEERSSLAVNGGLCYNTIDVFATTECGTEDNRAGDCRQTGKCHLDNTGYVCCCDLCSRRSLNKSTNFCGDDGVTYTSLCEYRRQQCVQNKKIEIHKGQCMSPDDTCAKRRNETWYRQATGMMPDGYVPNCEESNPNLYKITQCNMTGGLKCWCVMPDTNQNITQPVAVLREDELNCEQEMKIAMLSKSCEPCKMVREIIKAFPGANNYDYYYARQIENTRRITRTHEPRSDVGITLKLFAMFDMSRDNFLSSGELDLIARWLYISRECVLDTLSICDDDSDGRINTTEWCTCLMNRYSIT